MSDVFYGENQSIALTLKAFNFVFIAYFSLSLYVSPAASYV